jgi:hypothetical protein
MRSFLGYFNQNEEDEEDEMRRPSSTHESKMNTNRKLVALLPGKEPPVSIG